MFNIMILWIQIPDVFRCISNTLTVLLWTPRTQTELLVANVVFRFFFFHGAHPAILDRMVTLLELCMHVVEVFIPICFYAQSTIQYARPVDGRDDRTAVDAIRTMGRDGELEWQPLFVRQKRKKVIQTVHSMALDVGGCSSANFRAMKLWTLFTLLTYSMLSHRIVHRECLTGTKKKIDGKSRVGKLEENIIPIVFVYLQRTNTNIRFVIYYIVPYCHSTPIVLFSASILVPRRLVSVSG